jgi:putative colanic acid biosynthesis glycosyltransferase
MEARPGWKKRARIFGCLFLNAGDKLAGSDTLKNIASLLRQQTQPPAFIYGDSLEQGRHGAPFYKTARPHTARGMFTHHQAMLYRRKALGNLRYDLRYRIAADYDFTCRFLMQGKDALYCPFPLCVFESGGVSQKNALAGRMEEFRIRRDLKQVSGPANAAIFIRQSLTWSVRKIFPSFYRYVKGWRTLKERPASRRPGDDGRYPPGPGE